MATIREIAREADVSVGTVSNVLNNPEAVSVATRQRVLDVISAHNYRPNTIARSLATGQTLAIGLIISSITNPFFAELAAGVLEAAQAANCPVLIAESGHDSRDLSRRVDRLVQQRVDGILLASPPPAEAGSASRNLGATPVVVMADHDDQAGSTSSSVVGLLEFDWRSAGYSATRHLLDLGHRRIGHVGGIPGRASTARRAEGYRQALAEASVPGDAELVRSGDLLVESGYTGTIDLLHLREPPTALVLASDLMALGALRAAGELGLRVPRDLSLVGMDDIPLASWMSPPLTTVHVPARALGRRGLQMLLEARAPDAEPRRLVLPTRLVVRGSTGPPNRERQ